VWILDPRFDPLDGHFTGQVSARIPVGPLPYALDFRRTASASTDGIGDDTLLAIDARSRAITGRATTGREPVLAHVTPDGKSVLVVNRGDGSLGIHDAATLALRAAFPWSLGLQTSRSCRTIPWRSC